MVVTCQTLFALSKSYTQVVLGPGLGATRDPQRFRVVRTLHRFWF